MFVFISLCLLLPQITEVPKTFKNDSVDTKKFYINHELLQACRNFRSNIATPLQNSTLLTSQKFQVHSY
jgi:hypothetical protein